MGRPFQRRRSLRAFTMIEVLVAMCVLTVFSVGVLVTSWRLVGFARNEAERMVADNFAHDLMRAVYSQSYSNIVSIARFTVNPERALPRIVSTDVFGRQSVTYPLWRHQDVSHKPECEVRVTPSVDGRSKTIGVTVYWWHGDARGGYEELRYPDEGDSPLEQVRPLWGDGT